MDADEMEVVENGTGNKYLHGRDILKDNLEYDYQLCDDQLDCDEDFKIHPSYNAQAPYNDMIKLPTARSKRSAKYWSAVQLRRQRKHPYTLNWKPSNDSHASTPMALLNELKPGLKVRVSDFRRYHKGQRRFTALIHDSGHQYLGFGSSKKLAKQSAAYRVLRCLRPFALIGILDNWQTKTEGSRGEENSPNSIDFTSDESWSAQIANLQQEQIIEVANDDSSDSNQAASPTTSIDTVFKLPKNLQDKNPLMVLNEVMPGIPKNFVCCDDQDKEEEDEKQDDDEDKEKQKMKRKQKRRKFVMMLKIEDEAFVGEGKSKKQAKVAAAINVLRSKFHLDQPGWSELLQIDNPESTVLNEKKCENQMPTSKNNNHQNGHSTRQNKNPVMLLNEKIPKLKYRLKEECGKYDNNSFVMEVEVNGVCYEGYGKSKKHAKVGAAIGALRDQFGIEASAHSATKSPSGIMTSSSPSSRDNAASSSLERDRLREDHGGLPDLIYNLVRDKFGELTDNMRSPNAKHKVLAGIVMTRRSGPDVSEGEVIAISTGTKCINGSYISNQGTVLLDCHAEIVCRRGLMKYLYNQLLNYTSAESQNKAESIIEACESGKGYRVKSDVFFHLYINTTPCGDARIFSLREDEQQIDDHPNRKSRGQLRTKVEVGQGTIPVEAEWLVKERHHFNVQQTWDAVIGGERLLTMSCSDKISKWNVLGAQGALLSIFMEPVFFNSIIIGSLYHGEHVRRGLFDRANVGMKMAAKMNFESSPTTIPRPILASVSNPTKREASGKAPLSCLQWNVVDQETVMVNASTGQVGNGRPSQLCKREFLKLFLRLMRSPHVSRRVDIGDDVIENLHQSPLSYADWKNMATTYQARKGALMKGLELAGYGSWVGKPTEVDAFILTDTNPSTTTATARNGAMV